MGFWDMATLVSFWSLFGNRMADLGLIDSKLGLYIKINVNNGQNKFEVHISKNVAKMAILWPKIGQRHFGARASHGHNLAIFHQILTNEHTKMTSSLRRIEWNTILSSISLFLYIGFLAPFLLRGLTWAMLYVWTKNYPQVVGTCSGHHGQLISQNCVPTKIRAEPPPPPPPPPPLKASRCGVAKNGEFGIIMPSTVNNVFIWFTDIPIYSEDAFQLFTADRYYKFWDKHNFS